MKTMSMNVLAAASDQTVVSPRLATDSGGVKVEAEGHLTKVPRADGYFEVARRTRERLRPAVDPETIEQ